VRLQSFFDIAELQVKAIRMYDEAAAYLKHERLMYTLKNGNWGRSRDYFVDTVYHSLLEAMLMYPSRCVLHARRQVVMKHSMPSNHSHGC
jgi:hypothetical protein